MKIIIRCVKFYLIKLYLKIIKFFDAKGKLGGDQKKNYINIFNYIIRQKDTVINEFKEQIEHLYDQIELLSIKNNVAKEEKEQPKSTINNNDFRKLSERN